MPDSWKEAKVVLIPKEGNTDFKVLVSILVDRLNKIVGNYVSGDQTELIKHQYLKDNIRKVVNIVEWAQSYGNLTVLVFLDAKKAFDRIEWWYLKQTMKRLE